MKYKEQYDRKPKETTLRIGDWVLIHFQQDESGDRESYAGGLHNAGVTSGSGWNL